MNAYQNCEMKAKPHGQTSNTSILDAIHHHLLLKGMDGPKLSYKARLPSTGRDVLVVGPLHLTQPLSLALAHVQFDGETAGAASANRAVDVLRKHCSYTSPTRKRYIHTVESLENNNWDFRIDHIVLVTTPEDKHLLGQAQRILDDDYIEMQRVTIVEAQHGHSMERPKKREKLMGPTFPVYMDNMTSRLAVARMLLQRAKLGTWEGSPAMPHVDPKIFG